MQTRVFVVYCSPAGSTRRVAETIEAELKRTTFGSAFSLDLGKEHDGSSIRELIRAAPAEVCLFIGSPVYRDLAVTPIMRFIQSLPRMDRGSAVPFVTWGHACSGIALWEMGRALHERGFTPVGALKVPSLHSLMWSAPEPLGHGDPDPAALRRVSEFTARVCTRLQDGSLRPLGLDALLDQPPERVGAMREKLEAARITMPKAVNEAKCTQCGICRDECPASAIVLQPYPELGTACFDCLNCIRVCPEDAIEPTPSLPEIWDYIRKRAELINEVPRIRTFLEEGE
jgi:ferredoxin